MHEGRRPFVHLFSSERRAEPARALIRVAFRGLVESDAGTLRKEVPASLSPRPPGRLG